MNRIQKFLHPCSLPYLICITCSTHSFISSSGSSSGTVCKSFRRQTRITSSDVPEHEQPLVFHGKQISLSVFPKSPYCFNASSYNRLASVSALSDGITRDSWMSLFSESRAVWSFESVTLLVKLRRTNAIKTTCRLNARVT